MKYFMQEPIEHLTEASTFVGDIFKYPKNRAWFAHIPAGLAGPYSLSLESVASVLVCLIMQAVPLVYLFSVKNNLQATNPLMPLADVLGPKQWLRPGPALLKGESTLAPLNSQCLSQGSSSKVPCQ